MATESRQPSRMGYVIAAIIALLGIVGTSVLIGYVVYSILSLDGALTRFVAPGSTEVELDETGRYTVFYEYRSTVDGRDFRTDSTPPDLNIQVTSLETGDQIPVSSSFENVNYEFWNRAGEGIASFRIDEPGAYEISADYAGDADGPDFVLAFGEGIGTTILLSIGAAIGSGIFFCTTIVIALIVLVITLVRRSRTESPSTPPTRVSPH